MSEIYWITRLDVINALGVVGMMVGLFMLMLWGVTVVINDTIDKSLRKRVCKWSLPILFVSISIVAFVPTTKEMLLIYAAGGSWDYITNNETVKQLPDKCIQAIDALLDEYLDEPFNSQEHNKEEEVI